MTDLCNSIAAILEYPQGEILGTGFFITEQLVVTCSHVILSEEQQKKNIPYPEVAYIRRFGGNEIRPARILADGWSDCKEDDLAVLELSDPPTEKPVPLQLGLSVNSQNSVCQSFGYPEIGDYEGLWDPEIKVAGPVPNRTGRKRLQLSSNKIKGGFSGAPLYDSRTHQVIGIIAEVYLPGSDGKLGDLAFAIPVEALHQILRQISTSPSLIELLRAMPEDEVGPNVVDQLTGIRDQNRILQEWKEQHDILNNLGFYLEAFYQRVSALQKEYSSSDGLSLQLNWVPFEQGLSILVEMMDRFGYTRLQPPDQPTLEWIKQIQAVSGDIRRLINQLNEQNTHTLFGYTSNLHHLVQMRLFIVDKYLKLTAEGLEQLIAITLEGSANGLR